MSDSAIQETLDIKIDQFTDEEYDKYKSVVRALGSPSNADARSILSQYSIGSTADMVSFQFGVVRSECCTLYSMKF